MTTEVTQHTLDVLDEIGRNAPRFMSLINEKEVAPGLFAQRTVYGSVRVRTGTRTDDRTEMERAADHHRTRRFRPGRLWGDRD